MRRTAAGRAPLVLRKRPEAEVRQAAVAMLTKVGLQEKVDAYSSQLSGGQQQRVAIAPPGRWPTG